MIRRYSAEEEQRILVVGHVHDWTRAGLLTAEQTGSIEGRLATGLRRTNVFLRAVLGVFTALIVAAATGLVFVWFRITGAAPSALTFAAAAIVCAVSAEYLIGAFRLYRHGIEEALAAAAAALLGLSALAWTESYGLPASRLAPLTVAALASVAVYRRFGFVYAGVAAMVLAAMALSELRLEETTRRLVVALAFAAMFAAARVACLRHDDDVRAGEYASLQAAAYVGTYLTVNVRLFDVFGAFAWGTVARWFYWGSYAAVWLIPAAGLYIAVRDRDRILLNVSGIAALVTFTTNKPYLGLSRESWDPILLGVLLVVVATTVRRWLARGPGGQRGGFTAEKILERDRDWLRTLATASVAWPQDGGAARPAESPPSQFEGGRSGGAGGGAQY